ncbi:zinc ribbon domain-containing protein [Microseira sp. BLCC-F43]|uniref:zinc ribbon domain-containing protein n=1 Tax=Microseira sp. BLCC-F43 TaxID=3153602 RepID=UPI0035B92C17
MTPNIPAKASPKCGHTDKSNPSGEKFICTNCGYVEHADRKASREIAKRVGLVFPKNKKTRAEDCGKVTPVKVSTSKGVESRNHAYESSNIQLSLFDLDQYTTIDSRKSKRYGRNSSENLRVKRPQSVNMHSDISPRCGEADMEGNCWTDW